MHHQVEIRLKRLQQREHHPQTRDAVIWNAVKTTAASSSNILGIQFERHLLKQHLEGNTFISNVQKHNFAPEGRHGWKQPSVLQDLSLLDL